jgi:hypothetical protein
MGSHYSILKFVNNSLSNENIALGLIVVSNNAVFFKLSSQKITFAKKLNNQSAGLLDFSLNQLTDFFENKHIGNADQMHIFDNTIDKKYLDRLSNYNNGIIQFSSPNFINIDFTSINFNIYFEKFIGVEENQVIHKKEITLFKHNIQEKLYTPLRDKIDVDYTLKVKSLPTLYFNYHLDSIGINGAMYAAKSIDFNTKPIADIKHEIAEYECVIDRLNIFASNKGIGSNHNYYIIADEYKGSSPSYNDLYSLINEGTISNIKLIDSNNLHKLVELVEKNNAHKFSKELIM